MAPVSDLSDQSRQLFCNPAKNKKGGSGFKRKGIQQVQDQMGILFHPGFQRIPG
jgi:hypothetical protein